ncbi:hypothetical protein AB0I28_12610 [Phytomonospora sp. NPDC050363]|uniref:hypothetical protein n=1 Tax=Phytomonospora sp. NPDC050363 TaxID=3155642 RepID=UPI0033F3B373
MALIAAQIPSIAGTAVTMGAAASGDTCPVGAGLWLLVRNGDASPKTVTLTTPGNDVFGTAVPDKEYTIAAGAIALIPLLIQYLDSETNSVALTWSATTSVTRAVLRF